MDKSLFVDAELKSFKSPEEIQETLSQLRSLRSPKIGKLTVNNLLDTDDLVDMSGKITLTVSKGNVYVSYKGASDRVPQQMFDLMKTLSEES